MSLKKLVAATVVRALKIRNNSNVSIFLLDVADEEISNIIKTSAEDAGAGFVCMDSSDFSAPINYYFENEFEKKNAKALRVFGGGLSWGSDYEYATDFHSDIVEAISYINGAFCYRKNWATLVYPSQFKADYSGNDLKNVTEMMFNSVLLSSSAIELKQKKLKSKLSIGKIVHIIGDDVDLKFNIEGKKAVSCFGKYNIPDGEVFIAPLEGSANGWVHFDYLDWGLLEDVTLNFKKGKVVKSNAKTKIMKHWLSKKISIDSGAGSICEFAIGTNEEVKYMVGDPLFDEKKYGTFHLGLGGGYGSKIKSYRHWDLVKDNNKKYTILLDDVKILDNGEILI